MTGLLSFKNRFLFHQSQFDWGFKLLNSETWLKERKKRKRRQRIEKWRKAGAKVGRCARERCWLSRDQMRFMIFK